MPKHEYGKAGYYLQQKAVRRALIWIGPVFLVSIVAMVVSVSRPPLPVTFAVLFLGLVALAGRKKWERMADAAIDPWIKGYVGERDVADALRAALGDDCYLIHDIDLGAGNVDHVVVAPAGIYTVETKASGRQVETSLDSPRALLHEGPRLGSEVPNATSCHDIASI